MWSFCTSTLLLILFWTWISYLNDIRRTMHKILLSYLLFLISFIFPSVIWIFVFSLTLGLCWCHCWCWVYQNVRAHCCILTPITCTWAGVFGACSHLFRIIYTLQHIILVAWYHLILVILAEEFILSLGLLLFNRKLLSFFPLKIPYFLHNSIDLREDLAIVHHTDFMFMRKDVFYIIFELFTADGTDDMISSWSWLFNTLWMFLILGFLPFGIGYVIVVFLIKEFHILLGKFSFLLKLEDGCAIGSVDVESWQIVFSNIDGFT